MMTKEELEQVYNNPDPWGYQTNPADAVRKETIIKILNEYGPFEKALDIACGEAWITKDIIANEIYGIEVSEQAKSRWPDRVKKNVYLGDTFDLVLVTGALYENYDWQWIVETIEIFASKYIVTSHIADREYRPAIERIPGKQINMALFPYLRSDTEQFTQILRVFKI